MLAWYFAADDRKLRHGDGRMVRKGVTHKVEDDLVMCRNGLHASKRLIDALGYAPGSVLCRVRLGGEIVHGDDKCCARERTYLAVARANDMLQEFARKCALRVVHLWNAPDVVVRWLKTGDPALRLQAEADAAAARAAATSVDASYDASCAARAAAYAAAAADAASADATAAARAAATAAARAAEREWQARTLTRMANKLLGAK